MENSMRSDAKLGLVCAFVLVAGVAAYFGLAGGKGKGKGDEFVPTAGDAKKDDKGDGVGPLTLTPPGPVAGGSGNNGGMALGPRPAFGDTPAGDAGVPAATAPGN